MKNSFFPEIISFRMCLIFFLVIFISDNQLMADETTIASLNFTQKQIVFKIKVQARGAMLSVNGPGNIAFKKWFDKGVDPVFDLVDNFGQAFPDGTCTYELAVLPIVSEPVQKILDQQRAFEGTGVEAVFEPTEEAVSRNTQSGTFFIESGKITSASATVRQPMTDRDTMVGMAEDQVILDDLIVDGSACVGQDCVNGESFGFDTIRLKENNLRIKFQDTSNSASFPSNDWEITINDSSNGGANRFSIADIDGGRIPFTIEAGAPSHSLYVDDGGRIGLGTSTPVATVHAVTGNTPTLRLEQNGSSGFTPQTWDVAGNEANFFIRDASHGSALPFRIQPGTPSNTLTLREGGKVGIGTFEPTYPFEVKTNSSTNAVLVAQRTNGAATYMNASDNFGNFGTVTDHPLRLVVNSDWQIKLYNDGSMEMKDGGGYDGTWNTGSSRSIKENIKELSTEYALAALNGLTPVTYNYKKDAEERVGFIAEDVPDLVANKDRKSISAMDIVSTLTKVVQEQQKIIQEQQKINQEQQKTIDEFKNRFLFIEKGMLTSASQDLPEDIRAEK